jgi:hypothetical protein
MEYSGFPLDGSSSLDSMGDEGMLPIADSSMLTVGGARAAENGSNHVFSNFDLPVGMTK